MWFCGLQYASKKALITKKEPVIDELAEEDDEDLNSGVEVTPPSALTRYVRHLGCVFIYVTLQALNIATAGLMTLIAAFRLNKEAYHESLSGIHIIRRKNLTKFERSIQSK